MSVQYRLMLFNWVVFMPCVVNQEGAMKVVQLFHVFGAIFRANGLHQVALGGIP